MARMSGKDQRRVRVALLRRDGPVCYLCGREFDEKELGVEHKLPRSRGGRNTQDNLGLSCRPCDIAKGARTVEEYRQWQKEQTEGQRRASSRPLTHRVGDYLHYDPDSGMYVSGDHVPTKRIRVERDDKRTEVPKSGQHGRDKREGSKAHQVGEV